MKERTSMFEKKSIIATAILAGLVSGIALADETAPAPSSADGAKVEKKNSCKGMKNECKGKKNECKGKKNECKGKKHKKGDKDHCSGPNGCDGKDMKKGDAPAAKTDTTSTTTTTEKKSE
jgi:hypothetical protein